MTAGQPFQGAFRTPVELNELDPNRLIIQGANALYESPDQGETLREIPVAGNRFTGNANFLQNAIAVGGELNGFVNPDLLWAASGSNVFVRTNAGGQLNQVNTAPPVTTILDLAVDPGDGNSVFINDNNDVLVSTNAGNSWTNVTGDLLSQAATVWSLAYLEGPFVDAILAGTNLGVFASAVETLGTWIQLGDNLPNVPVYDMEMDDTDNVLVAGTLGRGAWLLDDPIELINEAFVVGREPKLIAVAPNRGDLFDLDPSDQFENVRFQSLTELVLTFGGPNSIDPTTLGAITVEYSESGNFSVDARPVTIGHRGLDDSGRNVTVRFAENLEDGFYQVSVSSALTSELGIPFAPNFPEPVPGDPDLVREVISYEIELGAKVVAVVPQPVVGGAPQTKLIEVYYDDIDLFRPGSTVTTRSFYQLVSTRNSVTTEDDFAAIPISVVPDAVNRKVTLEFASDLDAYVSQGESLRLRVGDSVNFSALRVTDHTVVADPGLTSTSANLLPAAASGSWSVTVGEQISNVGLTPLVDNPGGTYEPGHRDIEVENHLLFPDDRDGDNAITTQPYTFLRNTPYATNSQGDPLFNQMNADQEARFLEILDLYSSLLGMDFYETESSGLALIVGDLSTADPTVVSGPGGVAGLGGPGRVTMDALDFQNAASNQFGGSFFDVALHEIGHAIKLGHSYDLAPGTIMGSSGEYPDTTRPGPGTEWAFPGDNDILHGRYLHQREALDVDLYQVVISEPGILNAQTIAQRLPDASLLDTRLSLFVQDSLGKLELVSANDDYFGSDSFVGINVEPGTYFIGVSAEGNALYDVNNDRTSAGGTSEGPYELRVDFTSTLGSAIRDADGSLLDGDRDGFAGGNYNFWFEPIDTTTVYVNKDAGSGGDGSLANPFDNIPDALAAAQTRVAAAGVEGVVVRLLPSAGADGRVDTLADNIAYEVGIVASLNEVLDDGRNLTLPGGIHLVVDAGVIMKFLDSRISVGSDDDGNDRSEGTISVQGTPELPVYFTSFNDRTLAVNSNVLGTPASPGDWGGIEIRNDVDRAQGRLDVERLGIFQNYINHAEFSFGGGEVTTISRVIDPVHLSQARAEISYNVITTSSDAAISADPNTFQVTTFSEPRFQASTVTGDGFVSDYSRVGPSIFGNTLTGNSTNGMFVRIDTPPGGGLEKLTVPARFDDTDIVHVLGENLLLEGAAGGPVEDSTRPAPIIGIIEVGGGALAAGDYRYSYTEVDAFGFESPGSTPQLIAGVAAGSQINLTDIPAASGKYVARRLYRSFDDGSGPTAFKLVAELDKSSQDYTDNMTTPQAYAPVLNVLDDAVRHGRVDGSLIVDPGTIVKNQGARIELGFGATLLAEGLDGKEIIFTGRSDDEFGAGGTFDTNGDGPSTSSPAEWAGIYASPTSRLSIDRALIAYGGGVTGVGGGTAFFNPIQIHQADARIANTDFLDNAGGFGSTQLNSRRDYAPNRDATIFVTAAQPTIVGNTFIDNRGAAININVNSLNAEFRQDLGRQTGLVDRYDVPPGNTGPTIRGNQLGENDINGMQVRGEVLTTEVVFDDTDIVHVLRNDVEIPDLHAVGGMRLESSAAESLVVKLEDAEILATGRALDITDRIGGRLHVLGQPGFPVVMTSISDCTVGAGFTPDGQPNLDTLSNGACGVQTTAAVPYADVIVVMDESGSMGPTQAFSAQFVLDLEQALVSAGVGVTDTNQYGAVGFGGGTAGTAFNLGRSINVGAGIWGTANEYVTASTQFVTTGVSEDGFSGINFALQNYPFRPEAAKFIILATDEPRIVVDNSLSQAGVLADLQLAGVNLQGILGANIVDSNGNVALAIDNNNVYVESGTTYTVSPGGTITGGLSVADYVPLVQQTNGITGDLSQIGTSTQTATIFSRVLSQSILGQVSVANPSSAGDWQGLKFDAYSHDRNLAVHTEREGSIAGFGDENAEVGSDENIGRLASEEKAGDENIRLGFTIHGAIADPSDQDMYSFEGEAGTMVWFDIDQTDPQLDTVLELIDGDGRVLALSQDSRAEANAGQLTFVNTALVRDGHALPMQLDHDAERNATGEYRDLYSLNDGDSGMRVVLPGAAGTRTTFYVRVRSNGPLLNFSTLADIENTLPLGGSTQGGYRLQLRLQETDDFAGSVVRYADIRYATTAITAEGLPAHSPIAGELFNPGGTVDIGTFANTDRGAISVTGNAASVDAYQFNVDRDSLQGVNPTDNSQSIVIDVDWADGLTRPNTNAYLFAGDVLIALGTDSNVSDDRITPIVPGQPTTAKDLSRGSLGVRDAFIGPLELSPDLNYQVVIANDSQMIGSMTQFTQINAANTNTRLEPIDSTVRVTDDRFDFEPNGDTPVGDPTEIPEAVQVAFADDGSNIIPWQFGDVPLITVARNSANSGSSSQVNIFNPFTGRHDAIVTTGGNAVGAAAQSPRNLLLAIERPLGAQSDANTDQVYSIGPDGTFTPVGTTGIETYEYFNNGDNDPATNSNRRAPGNVDGVPFTALAYYNDANGGNSYLYGLADRPAFLGSVVGLDGNGNEIISGVSVPVSPTNIIYRLDPNTGAAQSRNGTPMPAGFQSASPLDQRLNNPPQNNLNMPPEAPWTGTNAIAQIQVPDFLGDVTSLVTDINGGQFLYAFTDTGSVWRFSLTEGNSGTYDPGDLVVPVVADAASPTGFRPADNNIFIDATTTPGIVDANGNTLVFDEVTQGPANFADVNDTVGINNLYFGVEAGTGRLYAFTMGPGGGVAQPVFEFGASLVQMDTALAGGGIAGLFFSPLDQALWHTSDTLSSAAGHGMGQLDDRAAVIGGGSLRLGFDNLNDDHSHLDPLGVFDNSLDAEDLQGYSGYNFLGGAHGAVQSNLLDLSGFSNEDLPTLYFTYLLDTEGRNATSEGVMQDSLRVSVAGEDGRWTLVATNNFADGINNRVWDNGFDGVDHEYEPVPSVGYTNVFDQRFVQELFDDDVFRQARIDLGPWAGQENVQIRFDFSTAGETRPDQTEIQALPGDQLTDGLTLVVTGQMPDRTADLQGNPIGNLTKQFEFDLGLVVQMPAGRLVTAPIALTRPDTTTIVELVPGPAGAGQVSVSPLDTAEDVADKVAAFIGGSALRSTAHPQWIGFSAEPAGGSYGFGALGNYIVSQPGITPTAVPITVNIAMSDIQVRNVLQAALANEIHYADVAPSRAAFPVVGNTSAVRIYDLAVTQTLAQNVVSLPGNDSLAAAQNLDSEQWTLDFDPIVENSTTRPHLTIQGQGDGTFDYFSFTAEAGAVATFDMDNTTFDTELHLYDASGNPLATDDDDNAGIAPGDMGSSGILDSFLQYTFTAPGTYIIGVGGFDSTGGSGGITGTPVPVGGSYQLHVSVDGKPVTGVAPFRPLTLISAENGAGSNMPGSDFGVYRATDLPGLITAGGRSRGLGGGNGVYIDDIVIGLADRGESVTGASGSGLVDNPYFEALFFDPLAGVARPVVEEVTSGTYQLELRLGREYLGDDNAGKDARIGLNERLADAFNVAATSRGSSLVDGDTFELSNGFETVRFEFNDIDVPVPTGSTAVLPGNVAVNYRISDTVGIVGNSIRAAINSSSVRSVLGIEATSRGGELSDPTDPVILLHGYAAADNQGGTTFVSPESGLSHLIGIVAGQNVVLGEDTGDRNRLRDQGQFIVDSNIISFSSNEAINIRRRAQSSG